MGLEIVGLAVDLDAGLVGQLFENLATGFFRDRRRGNSLLAATSIGGEPGHCPDADMTTYIVESTLEDAEVDVDHEIVEREVDDSDDGEDDGYKVL